MHIGLIFIGVTKDVSLITTFFYYFTNLASTDEYALSMYKTKIYFEKYR